MSDVWLSTVDFVNACMCMRTHTHTHTHTQTNTDHQHTHTGTNVPILGHDKTPSTEILYLAGSKQIWQKKRTTFACLLEMLLEQLEPLAGYFVGTQQHDNPKLTHAPSLLHVDFH